MVEPNTGFFLVFNAFVSNIYSTFCLSLGNNFIQYENVRTGKLRAKNLVEMIVHDIRFIK